MAVHAHTGGLSALLAKKKQGSRLLCQSVTRAWQSLRDDTEHKKTQNSDMSPSKQALLRPLSRHSGRESGNMRSAKSLK